MVMTIEQPSARLLVVDDDPDFLDIFGRAAERSDCGERCAIVTATGPDQALDRLAGGGIDVVITDVLMPGKMDGYGLFREIRRLRPDVPVILLTAYGSVEKAVRAVQEGVFHYFEKPIRPDGDFWGVIDRAINKKRLTDQMHLEMDRPGDRHRLIGNSPAMRRVESAISQVAATSATVLITGETGTGKELVARNIHHLSRRSDGPFVAVNSAALTDTILESELFGHVKGSFTGAAGDHCGVFERAHGGTLFLDEIGELRPRAQAEMLRVLDDRTFTPVGATEERTADFRLVCATNRRMENLVDEGHFRRDLWFRLNVFPIELPPLSNRRSDIPLLAAYFLVSRAAALGRPVKTISDEAMIFLHQYHWPGNVRELRNLIERGLIAASGDEIDLVDIFPDQVESAEAQPVTSLKEMERLMIRLALERSEGNKTAAAKRLGIGLKTLYEKLKRYNLA